MHWTLPQLRALRRIEYDALRTWLDKQQPKAAAEPQEHEWA